MNLTSELCNCITFGCSVSLQAKGIPAESFDCPLNGTEQKYKRRQTYTVFWGAKVNCINGTFSSLKSLEHFVGFF